jgi:hypothetical protein
MLTAKYTNGLQETLELHRLRIEYEKLLAMYTIILPKINQVLIADLLSREIEYYNEDKDAPMYTIEVFTKSENVYNSKNRYGTIYLRQAGNRLFLF